MGRTPMTVPTTTQRYPPTSPEDYGIPFLTPRRQTARRGGFSFLPSRACAPVRLKEYSSLGHLGHRDRKTAEPALQILVQHLRLEHVFDELFGRRDVLCPFRDRRAKPHDLGRHLLAVTAGRQSMGYGLVVLLFVVVERKLGRDR